MKYLASSRPVPIYCEPEAFTCCMHRLCAELAVQWLFFFHMADFVPLLHHLAFATHLAQQLLLRPCGAKHNTQTQVGAICCACGSITLL